MYAIIQCLFLCILSWRSFLKEKQLRFESPLPLAGIQAFFTSSTPFQRYSLETY